MAILTYKSTDNNNRYLSPAEQQPEITYAGRVLSTKHYTVHVHSDSAWLDSGDRTSVDVWDGGRIHTIATGGGYSSTTYNRVEVDATDEVRAIATEYTTFTDWMSSVLATYQKHDSLVNDNRRIRYGAHVTVTAGRKVKKGTEWYVTGEGNGPYGPYVHLTQNQDGSGEKVRFVNPDNLRTVEREISEPVYPVTPYGYTVNETIVSLVLELAALMQNHNYNYNQDKINDIWCVLHDAWADSDYPVPEALRRAAFRCD